MIDDKKVLALIPARGGSKGLPRKNVLEAGGRPLVAWTIGAAQESKYIDRVVLSSDDDEIIAKAQAWGCDVPFRRPVELATDTIPTMDVVFHALDSLPNYDYLVLLQPTSPLRTGSDIDAAIEQLRATNAFCCVSVCLVEENPYWMYRLGEGNRLESIIEAPRGASRRQDLPPVYTLNGAIYIAQVGWLRQSRTFISKDTLAFVMPRNRSIDIDTAEDFECFKAMIANGLPG